MRATLRLADPAVVLLDDLPVAGQPGAIRTRPARQALDHTRRLLADTGGRRPGRQVRLAGTTIPPGSGAAASSSSISMPITG